jgi:site-specific recombinase
LEDDPMPLATKLKDRFSLTRLLRLRDPRRDLSSILQAADPTAPLAERIAWLTHLMQWVRKKSLVEESAAQRMVRVRFLLQLLDRQPEWKSKAGAVLVSVLRDSEAPLLFAQTELSEHHALFSEFFRRVGDRVIPSPPRVGELSYALDTIFHDAGDLVWL